MDCNDVIKRINTQLIYQQDCQAATFRRIASLRTIDPNTLADFYNDLENKFGFGTVSFYLHSSPMFYVTLINVMNLKEAATDMLEWVIENYPFFDIDKVTSEDGADHRVFTFPESGPNNISLRFSLYVAPDSPTCRQIVVGEEETYESVRVLRPVTKLICS